MPRRHPASAVTRLLLFTMSAIGAPAALKTIDNPQGGRIVYGQVEGAASEARAMGAVLRAMHNQFGDRPNVGRIFWVNGTNSVAAFFTFVSQAQPGKRAIGGLGDCGPLRAGPH